MLVLCVLLSVESKILVKTFHDKKCNATGRYIREQREIENLLCRKFLILTFDQKYLGILKIGNQLFPLEIASKEEPS